MGYSDSEIVKRLEEIRKGKQRQTYSGQPYGPATIATYRYHRNMIKALSVPGSKRQYATLLEFLRGGRFNGRHEYFEKNSRKWRRLLLNALGDEGVELYLYFRPNRGAVSASVHDVISSLLTSRGVSPRLRHASFAYAYLRVIYGLSPRNRRNGDSRYSEHQKWWRLLDLNIQKNSLSARGIDCDGYLHQLLQEAKHRPPLAGVHSKLAKVDRDVLSGLKFSMFLALAVNPVPGRYDF